MKIALLPFKIVHFLDPAATHTWHFSMVVNLHLYFLDRFNRFLNRVNQS